MKLAILICHLPERKEYLDRLVGTLIHQMNELNLLGGVVKNGDTTLLDDVGIFINDSPKPKTTGAKRNELIEEAIKAGAKYIAFFDDDDMPGENYIKHQLAVVESGADCGSLIGNIYFSGKKDTRPFLHSLKYTNWYEDANAYYRCPNHLNAMKLDLIKDIKFEDRVFGEDGNFSYAVRDAGVLKTEYVIEEVLYHYFVGTIKHEVKCD